MKLKSALLVVAFLLVGVSANAATIDLSSWSALSLDYGYPVDANQPAGSWTLEFGNTAVVQTLNADPSFYLNGVSQTSYSMDGSWQVLTTSDDDYMGFVFGYQNSSNFYLFDWKQTEQDYYGHANEGMTIKRMTGSTGDAYADLTLGEFWVNNTDSGDMTRLAYNHGVTAGWVDNVLYGFHLDYNLSVGEIRIVVTEGSDVLWDITIYDTTFDFGQFGFYNYSQGQVRYAGFEQTGGVTVPEPATLSLLGIGLVGLIGGAARKKLKKKAIAKT